MRKIVSLIFVVIFCALCVSCEVQNTGIVSPLQDYDFITVTLEQINEEFDNNGIRAKDTYIGKYVSIKLVVEKVSEEELVLKENRDQLGIFSYECRAKVVNKNLRDKLSELDKGNVITVKGKITDLTEGIISPCHVSMDLYEF